MEMTQIRYFLAVSETLNFTRAAELCFISQPALTKGIKKLEASIGGELLHRTKNSVQLSYLGKNLLPKFRQIYLDADTAKKEAKRLLKQESCLLRIGIQSNIFIGCLMPVFQGFLSENPGVQFEFLEADKHELKHKLDNHELDMVFVMVNSIQKDSTQDEVYAETFVVAFGAKHAFVNRHQIHARELNQQCFCYRTHCSSSHQLNQHLSEQGINLNIVYSSDRDDWVKSFVRGNFGLTFLPKTQALTEGLSFVEIADYQVTRSIVMETTNAFEQRSPVCHQFIEAIPSLAKEYSRQLQMTESMEHFMPSHHDIAAETAVALNNAV